MINLISMLLICLFIIIDSDIYMIFDDQLDIYVIDLYGDNKFFSIKDIISVVEKIIKIKKNLIFLLVYIFIKLSFFYRLQLLQ